MDNADLMNLLERLLAPATDATSRDYRSDAGQTLASLAAPSAPGMPAPRAIEANGLESSPVASIPGTAVNGVSSGMTALMSAVMSVGIAILDASSLRIQRTNAMLAGMLGRRANRESLLGMRIDEAIASLPTSDVETAQRHVRRTGMPFSSVLEEPARSSDRGATYRRYTLSPLHAHDGQLESLLFTIMDVTDQVTTRQRMEEASERVREQDHYARLRVAIGGILARGLELSETLALAAETIATRLADACAVFLPDDNGAQWPWAVYHRNPELAAQLVAAFNANAEQRPHDVIQEVLATGSGLLRIPRSPAEAAQMLGIPQALAHTLGARTVAGLPLRDALEPFGALLVFSTQRAAGGSGVELSGDDMDCLTEVTDQLALVVQNARLRRLLQAGQGRQEAILALIPDGVIFYDAHGQVQYMNAAAARLLAPPNAPGGDNLPAAQPYTVTALDGRPLPDAELPWMRAIHGSPVGLAALEPVSLTFPDGSQLPVLVRAIPILDQNGTPTGAAVLLRGDGVAPAGQWARSGPSYGPAGAPLPSGAHWSYTPLATGQAVGPSTTDLGELCARVARMQGASIRRRVEVRLPRFEMPVTASLLDVETCVSTVLEAAAAWATAGLPLTIAVAFEAPGAREQVSSRPLARNGAHGASSLPQIAQVRISAAHGDESSPGMLALLDDANVHAAGFQGSAYFVPPESGGPVFVLRVPIAFS